MFNFCLNRFTDKPRTHFLWEGIKSPDYFGSNLMIPFWGD